MKTTNLILILLCTHFISMAQHVGIVRKNYFSSYFDSTLMTTIQQLDSSTIRLGSINPTSGMVTNLGTNEYTMGINLTGSTVDPYANKYFISSGNNILTFDMTNGNIVSDVPITGPFATSAFQNYRLNPSDTTIYGLVPNNYYSTYFDSSTMSTYQVLDSSHIRFAKLDPVTGQYSLIGNTNLDNVYTLAGNSIDPHQMIFYYSAVDTLVGVDLYTGNIYSQTAIQSPANSIFENFTYSCADTTIYGLLRQNYVSTIFDSALMQYIDVVDSFAIRLSKINPTTGVVTIISPNGLGLGATLNGSCFIDPNTMIYYFSNGTELIGVSLQTGLIVSSVTKTFQSGGMYYDMMRSTSNCLGALKVRANNPTGLNSPIVSNSSIEIFPNPSSNFIEIKTDSKINSIELFELNGRKISESKIAKMEISSLPYGMYIVKVNAENGTSYFSKFSKQ